ncbi:unnamed protein product [Ophioblennius macclurei]
MNSKAAKRDEKGRNIQVVVRCRPFNTTERKTSSGVVDCDPSRKEVNVRMGGKMDKSARKTYTFDMVFDPSAKQIEVYRSVVVPILDEVFMGYNCTVFAYGQTGTGKTFTMEGERSPNDEFTWEEDPLAGIIPRTLHQIFEKLSENGTEFSIKVSLLEIYNEELFDLLTPSDDVAERLQLFDDPRTKLGVVVKGLEEVTVHNKDEVYQILERGAAKRRTACTLMNAYSSRSHSVFSVTIHMKEVSPDGEELVKIGKLNLVDLAGSENIGRSGAVDKRAREAGSINQSLLTLGRVITALVEKRPHIPYRESKLTRILQDSLGGRTKTSIIATVSPSSSNLEETLSTLDYASRAKNIINKPEVNQKLTKAALIKEYTEEIRRLKCDLAAARDKSGFFLSAENYDRMVGQIASHEDVVTECQDKIAAVEEELRKVVEMFGDSKTQLEQVTVDLQEKQQRLREASRDLQETKEKLLQEEFVSSELSSAQERLYSAAGQLLSTVDQSTSDVSGLHAKLERVTKVEQHNQQAQQSFMLQMDGCFGDIQNAVRRQGEKQRCMLGNCSQAFDGLLQMNRSLLKDSAASVASLMGGFRAAVEQSVARCVQKVEQDQALGAEAKRGRLQLLEEHRRDVEEVLAAQALTGLSAVKELTDALTASMEAQRALADEVEAMKESAQFFRALAQELAALRQDAVRGLSGLQDQLVALQGQILQEEQRQQTSIESIRDQLNRALQDHLDQNFSGLRSASVDVCGPVRSLQETISSGCSSVEERASSGADHLGATSRTLASSLHANSERSLKAVEEVRERCSQVHASVSGLLERHAQWSAAVSQDAENRAEERRSRTEEIATESRSLQQSVEERCSQQLQALEEELSGKAEEAQRTATEAHRQTSEARSASERQEAELQEQLEAGRGLLCSFLQEELQRDAPTGSTPQRRQFVYPRRVATPQSRGELLESLRRQQEVLQEVLQEEQREEEEEEEEEDKQSHTDPDSVEDDSVTLNESESRDGAIDENLDFNQSVRVPFFKKKKGGKKESKNLGHDQTPPRSKLPLRCQN